MAGMRKPASCIRTKQVEDEGEKHDAFDAEPRHHEFVLVVPSRVCNLTLNHEALKLPGLLRIQILSRIFLLLAVRCWWS